MTSDLVRLILQGDCPVARVIPVTQSGQTARSGS